MIWDLNPHLMPIVIYYMLQKSDEFYFRMFLLSVAIRHTKSQTAFGSIRSDADPKGQVNIYCLFELIKD